MSDLNKIPFGLRESDNALVDVYDVPNGKQCGCVCPSCHTPLEARQGNIKIWHFAHASKNVFNKTKNECEYSFYLSVRLMARQLIGKQIKLSLPEYKGTIEFYEGILRYKQYQEFLVTKEQDITLDNLEVENTFSGVAVDLIGTIGSFKFVVYFTHPERNVPDNLFNPTDSKCGVIQIALDLLKNQFKTANSENKTYHEILTDFLTNNRKSKKWIYHPRFEQCAFAAVEKLKTGASNFEYTIHRQNNNPHFVAKSSSIQKSHNHESSNTFQDLPNKWIRFECVVCKSRWEGYEAGGNQCPKCETSLYSRPIS